MLIADDLRSLERTEHKMVRWMCGVSLKDIRRSENTTFLVLIVLLTVRGASYQRKDL